MVRLINFKLVDCFFACGCLAVNSSEQGCFTQYSHWQTTGKKVAKSERLYNAVQLGEWEL